MEESTKLQNPAIGVDTELAICVCCGMTEECTAEYVAGVRERYGGKWICGLCGDAINDKVNRSENKSIGFEEALELQMKFCQQFKLSSPPTNASRDLISALNHILRRSLNTAKRKKTSLVFPSC